MINENDWPDWRDRASSSRRSRSNSRRFARPVSGSIRERVSMNSYMVAFWIARAAWPMTVRRKALSSAVYEGRRRDVSANQYEALQPEAIHPERSLVTPTMVADAHSRKQAVNTWTVDREEDMLRMSGLGVDAIITNYPQRLEDVMHRLESADL